MSSTRQDAWTHDEDLLLAEVVLRHIRDGGTQLQAFEEVGKQMNRTAAACGFRWNSYVRKQYKSGIELAKKQRKERKGQVEQEHKTENETSFDVVNKVKESENKANNKLQLKDVIEYLTQLKDKEDIEEKLMKENLELKNQEAQLKKALAELNKSYEDQKKEFDSLQQEYSSMIALLERARKMAVLQEK